MTRLYRRFPPELRTASVVPRWSIIWTLTRDSVANHSFFVTFYAREIAVLIEWQGYLDDLMYMALVHDLEETATGDVVSTVKAEIIDDKRAAAYIDRKMRERMPFVADDMEAMGSEEIKRIIKAADKLDALIFLMVERRLGNGVIAPHLPSAHAKFEAAWRNLPADKDKLDELWNTCMVPAIKEHEVAGGFGI